MGQTDFQPDNSGPEAAVSRTLPAWHRLGLVAAITGSLALGGCSFSRSATPQVMAAAPVSTAPSAVRSSTTPRPQPSATPRLQPIPGWSRGRLIRRVTLPPGKKLFALTFDDGPIPAYTPLILRVLREHKVRATFYMLGIHVARYPQLVQEVVRAGHAVGSHSWSHRARAARPQWEIRGTDTAILKAGGIRVTTFRPPYGLAPTSQTRAAAAAGHSIILWSADPQDWRARSATTLSNIVLRQASPGGIVVMHDGGGNRTATAASLPAIINGLRRRGYQFVTVPELLRAGENPSVRRSGAGKGQPRGTPAKKKQVPHGSAAPGRGEPAGSGPRL